MSADIDFFKELSHTLVDVFEDPLSDRSRKRQSYVLVLAIISIMLSSTLISPSEFDISGIKFTLSQPEVLIKVFGLLTGYFLSLYVLDLYQDMRISRYKMLRIGSMMKGLADETRELLAEREAKLDQLILLQDDLIEKRAEALSRGNHELHELAQKDGLDELQKETQEMLSDRSVLNKAHLRASVMKGSYGDYQMLLRLRMIIEIVFPILLGLYAMSKSLF